MDRIIVESIRRYIVRFAALCLAITALAFVSISCSLPVDKRHVYEVGNYVSLGGDEEKIILEVSEKGLQSLFFVDGDGRDTHFAQGKYSYVSAAGSGRLPFLDIVSPMHLWDNIVKIDGNWYAINMAGSMFLNEKPFIQLVIFDGLNIRAKARIPIPEVRCPISTLAIEVTGRSLVLRDSTHRFFQIEPLGNEAGVIEISESEFQRKMRSSQSLEEAGIHLDMGVNGYFGVWCQ